jgi:hypothetical protein
MPVRRNLIAVAVLALTGATAAGGAAYAAGGDSPTVGAPNPKCATVKAVADSVSVKDRNGAQRLDAAAKALGVSTQKLTDAFVATKQWVGTSGTKPTPEAFAGHVASLLGKDAATVQKALIAAGMLGDGPSAVVVKESGKERDQHFAAAAKELGISTQKLTDALVATKQWVGSTSDKPTLEAFTAHVASVLGLDAAKVAHALDVNGVFRAGPVIKTGAPGGKDGKAGPTGGPVCSVPDKAQAQEITAAAKTLGVTDARLLDALKAAKQSLGASGTKPTPEAFAGQVASTLGLPADTVLHALESAGIVGTDSEQKAEMSE